MMRRFGLRDDQWERIKDLLPGREGSVGGPRRTIGCSSKPCSIVIVRGCLGAICRSGSVTEFRCIGGSAVGPKAVSGSGCSNISQQTPTTNMR